MSKGSGVERFNPKWYLRQNPDVARSGMDPFRHYVSFGRSEGRCPAPDPFFMRNAKRLHVLRTITAHMAVRSGVFRAILAILAVLWKEGWSGFSAWASRSMQEIERVREPALAYASYRAEVEEPGLRDHEAMAMLQARFAYRPKFSIAVPVFNVEAKWLRRCIESVQAQVYDNWELCIADDCSTAPHIRPLLDEYSSADQRIKIKYRDCNGHISAATNTAIEMSTGDYICLMDNDDEIAPNALFEFAALLDRDTGIDMIYSDEDKLGLDGLRYEPFFKPDWSPESLEGCMYTAHFACYRASIVRKLGGFRTGYDGAQDYDFVLRFTEQAKKIVHVPKVLYHWRAIPGSTAATMDAKDYVLDAAVRALRDRADRVNGGGEVRLGKYAGSFDVRYMVRGQPLVSAIIPSAGRHATIRGGEVDLLVNVVKTLHECNSYRHFEVIVVDNGDLREETKQALAPYNCRFVHFDSEFNIATKMNMGAAVARGEYLLFLNDDVEAISSDWLECMLQLAQRPEVGVVGAKLYFENGTIQHAGVAFCEGLPDHVRREAPGADPGYFFSSCANRNYMAVTGAVLMSPRKVFEGVGGFDERFAINYNDVDYCLKVFATGLRVVFAAGAELFHFESISRERTVSPHEIALFRHKWNELVAHDPYYSSNFESRPPDFRLRTDWTSMAQHDPLDSAVLSHGRH